MKKTTAFLLALLFYASILPWTGWADEYHNYNARNVTGDNTGRLKDMSIGSASYTDNGNFADLITRGPWVSVRSATSLSTAQDNAVALGRGLLIDNAVTLSDNTTITVPLTILKGGSIALAGYTLTLNGSFSAGFYTVFTGTGTVTYNAAKVREIYPEWRGAVGDGATDDSTAVNATFSDARSGGNNVAVPGIYLNGIYKVTTPINGGGFGNDFLHLYGRGRAAKGAGFYGVMAGGVVLDLTGNENMLAENFRVEGDTSSVPDVGILLAATNLARTGNVRGGNYQMINVQVHGSFDNAAMYLYGAEQSVLDRCTLGAGGSGVVVAVSNRATPTLAVSSSFYTLDTTTAGITTYTAQNVQYGLGGTGRAAIFIENVTSIYNEINPKFVLTSASSPYYIEALAVDQMRVVGVRGEAASSSGFLKTDGFKNSEVRGYISASGGLIDLEATHSTGGGIIQNSIIGLAGATGQYLINKPNATDNAGLVGNIIQLMDSGKLHVDGTKQVSGNLIFNYLDAGDNNVILHDADSSDDGNVIIGNRGFRMYGGVSGQGAGLKNFLTGTAAYSPNIADNATATTTVTVTGATFTTTSVPDIAVAAFGHAGATGGIPAGILVSASVTGVNTVTVTFYNKSGGTWNPAAGTLRATVFKH